MLPVHLADVIDAADIVVGHRPGCAHLVVESGQPGRVLLDRHGQEFEGHRLAELQVVGTVDLPHPPLAQKPDDPVALGEDGAGQEPPPGDVG